MMPLWDALRMNMMISYQELVRTFPKKRYPAYKRDWLVILMLNNFNKKQRATTLLLFLAGNNLRFVN
ncbi:hypothetical protein, partial [Klebsiella pneumoniae]|uniref:hypothetical protein n=1 Tax=Klebsiella pneumoniae TaxID=573 RepID=UPI003872A3FE